MKPENKEAMKQKINMFRLPTYNEIPDVGLYLEQVTKYVTGFFEPIESVNITASMISNYVKKGLIANPVKKQYYREQIADVLFIAIAKTVISLEEIQILLEIQRKSYDCRKAYEFFVAELELALAKLFDIECDKETQPHENNDDIILVRNVITTVAHKIYLDKVFLLYMNRIDK
ncbi:MAG: DUF1836 domain-containing protein [Clostridia bacterium]|nr:DUF1836 domain-containing protein [Clostridia bacterium]